MKIPDIYTAEIDDPIQTFNKNSMLSMLQMLAVAIIQKNSGSRLDTHGGYPDQYAFLDDLVVVGGVDHDGAPDLTILMVADFVAKNECWLEDDEEWSELLHKCLQR